MAMASCHHDKAGEMKRRPLPSQERLNELFTYESGQLFWKVSRRGIKVGDLAGCRKSDGYWTVMVGGKHYLRHRLIWKMFYGEPPADKDIDHINEIKGDDRIENLQLLSARENVSKGWAKHKKSGLPTGVAYVKNSRVNPYKAQVYYNGKKRDLGNFPTVEAAEAAYLAATL